MVAKNIFRLSPVEVILVTMLIMIFVGTALLALPISRTEHINLIDLIFTSASATCVTGFFTVPLHSFTTFGLVVILLLIQIGALGLTTMMLFFLSLFIDL